MKRKKQKEFFQCPFCPERFTHKDSLEARKKRFNHVVKVHKNSETE